MTDPRPCAACDETRRIVGRGLCCRCWQRAKASNTLEQYGKIYRTFAESLAWAKEHGTDEGCWPWPCVASNGYGTSVCMDGRNYSAHVASWVTVNGPVPEGLSLDHLCHTNSQGCPEAVCRHRACVNPDHLEPVTPLEQQRRRHDVRSGVCRRGHLQTEVTRRRFKDRKGHWKSRCRECQFDAALVFAGAERVAAIADMLSRGISQRRIADKLGLERSQISRVKTALARPATQ